MVESEAKLRSAPWRRQKLHLVLSAMRHFAAELEDRGVEVDYVRPEPPRGVASTRAARRPDSVRLLEPSSAGGRELSELDRVELVKGTLFLTHPDEFRAWADGRKRLVMEDFYASSAAASTCSWKATSQPADAGTSTPRTASHPRATGALRARTGHARATSTRCGVTSIACGCPPSARTVRGCGPPRTVRPAGRSSASSRAGCRHFGRWQDAMRTASASCGMPTCHRRSSLGLLHPLDVAEAAQRATARGTPDRCRRGLRPSGDRLARVRVGHVLAARARLALDERAGRRPCPTTSGAARPTCAALPIPWPACARRRMRTTSCG